jgi:hypothetical protein
MPGLAFRSLLARFSAVIASLLLIVVSVAPHAHGTDAPLGGLASVHAAYNLRRDEARGGHTIGRHVGKSDEELRARLEREPRIRAASTYKDLATAERVVAETLAHGGERLATWLLREGPRPNLVLSYDGNPRRPIGRSLRRGERKSVKAHDAIVVLKWDSMEGSMVLTSYPEVR